MHLVQQAAQRDVLLLRQGCEVAVILEHVAHEGDGRSREEAPMDVADDLHRLIFVIGERLVEEARQRLPVVVVGERETLREKRDFLRSRDVEVAVSL